MGFDIGSLAQGAAGAIIGQTFGRIGEKHQDERQVAQQQKLTDQQLQAQKSLQGFNIEQTSAKKQRERLEEAGLNAGLMYGQSGAGGASTGGGSVVGGQAADAASTSSAKTAQTGMGLQIASQIALQKAQKENIEADTANKIAGTENTGAQTEGTKIENTVKKETQEATINTIKEKAFQQLAETGISEQNRSVGAETMNDRISKIKNEAIGQILTNEATRTGINLNNERINEIANAISQRWKSLELEGKSQQISIENMDKLTEAMLWGAGIQATGNIVKSVVDIATKKPNHGTATETLRRSGDGWSETHTTTIPR